MSLKQAIKHGKEHRKPYYDSRRFDFSCRNHGKCSWCQRSRLRQGRLFSMIEIEENDRLGCLVEMSFGKWNRYLYSDEYIDDNE